MARETFNLGGRSFVYVEETTVEHDEYMEARLRPAGLHEITMQIGEDAEAFARRLVLQSAESGVRRELLGALIVPAEAKQWTPEIAAETAAFLGKLRDEEDKNKLRLLFTSMLFRFFADGISSCYAYKRSLDEALAETDPDPEKKDPAAAGDDGLTSSELSPDTTTTVRSE